MTVEVFGLVLLTICVICAATVLVLDWFTGPFRRWRRSRRDRSTRRYTQRVLKRSRLAHWREDEAPKTEGGR